MKTIKLTLDNDILDRARDLAEARKVSLDELVTEALRRLAYERDAENGLIGLFAEEPELLDDVINSAMDARERDPLRSDG